MEKILLIWISDQQAERDHVNSTLMMQKAKRMFDTLKASLHWCLFTKKIRLVLKYMTSLE
jgi:hypothetical protein